jgi:hypothetical protein
MFNLEIMGQMATGRADGNPRDLTLQREGESVPSTQQLSV